MKFVKVDNGLAHGTITKIRKSVRMGVFTPFNLDRHAKIGLQGSVHGNWTEPTKFRWGAE